MLTRRFSVGRTIFREGELSDQAYILRSGRVEVIKNTPSGPLRLAVLGQGDVVGEMGLLDDRPRSATARAVSDVVAETVDRAEFVRLLLQEPVRSMELLRALFERLRTMNRMLSESATATARTSPVPHIKLIPLTPETSAVLPADGIEVTRFPFRIGRRPESREAEVLSFNEIELADSQPYTLSLNHFALDLGPDGVVVRDRGSQHGTLVNQTRIGVTAARDFALLHRGENEVIAGAPHFHRSPSSFRFRVVVE